MNCSQELSEKYRALWDGKPQPQPSPKPAPPTLAKKAANFLWAFAAHVAQGMPTVTDEVYQARLSVCNSCDLRNGNTCQHPACGCNLSLKAWWREQKCPLGKWPAENQAANLPEAKNEQ